jgi:hypothetical protein
LGVWKPQPADFPGRQRPTAREQTFGTIRQDVSNLPLINDDRMPAEIDFSKGVRGLHHIPAGAKVFMPASIGKNLWEYFPGKASVEIGSNVRVDCEGSPMVMPPICDYHSHPC